MMSSVLRSDHLFGGLSHLVLKNVGGYFLSLPSSDPPPYSTVLTNATILALSSGALL